MADNIVDFNVRLNKVKEAAAKPVLDERFKLPISVLLMDPAFQFEILKGEAINLFTNPDLGTVKIHRLFNILTYLFEGVLLPFGLKTNWFVRHLGEATAVTDTSIYGYGMQINRVNEQGEMTQGSRPNFQIELGAMEFEDDDIIDKGTIYDVEKMVFDIPEDSVMTKRLPKHLIKKMNNMVSINGGFGAYTETGYVVVVPYCGKIGIYINLDLENPIGTA